MKVGEFLDICDYTAKIRIKMEQLGMTWTSEYAYRERWRENSAICRAEIQNVESRSDEFIISVK